LAEGKRQELEKSPEPEQSLFQTLADDWGERFLGQYSSKEQVFKSQRLAQKIYPVLGGLPVSAITPRLILEKI
jgi:hypothetical protein